MSRKKKVLGSISTDWKVLLETVIINILITKMLSLNEIQMVAP